MLIAGQAVARGLTLITHNTRNLQQVEGLLIEDLLIEDWEAWKPPAIVRTTKPPV